jgi:rod shape-determining protein MreB
MVAHARAARVDSGGPRRLSLRVAWLQRLISRPVLALDVGTAMTRLHAAGRLSAVSRPSVVSRRNLPAPALQGGVVIDADAAAEVVADLLRWVDGRGRGRPRVLACVPSDASPDERAALVEAVRRAGASGVALLPEPVAAARGFDPDAGAEAEVAAVLDIGEGVTDLAVVRGGELVASEALRVGVADLRAAVCRTIRLACGVRVGATEAERVLREIGVLDRGAAPRTLTVVGSPTEGIGPVRARVEVAALRPAIESACDPILGHVAGFLARLPDDLADALCDAGLWLTGGGALLRGMPECVVGEARLAVRVAPRPLHAVVDGAWRIAREAPPSPRVWQ